MKTNFYIHIGLHKTGSTSIQATLFKNRAVLRDHGIHYLGLSQNHSTTLYPLFRKDLSLDNWDRLADVMSQEDGLKYNASVEQALHEELESNTCERFVISGEGLSRLYDNEIEDLKAKLAPHAASFRIVAYVREPYSYINSAFQQKMRVGRTIEEIVADPPLPQYRRIDSFFRVFGREHVDVRIFDPDRFVDGDLIADFLAATGAPPTLAKQIEIVRRNTAMSHEAALLLNEINKQHPRRKGERENPGRANHLRKKLEQIPGQRFRCPRAALEAAEPEFANDLRWLRRVLGERVFTAKPEPDDLVPNWSGETIAALATLLNDMGNEIEAAKKQRVAAQKQPASALPAALTQLWARATRRFASRKPQVRFRRAPTT